MSADRFGSFPGRVLARRSPLPAICSAALLWGLISAPAAAAAAARTTEDVPIAGGTVAMAKALGLDGVPDRPRFVAELVRVLYDSVEGRNAVVDAKLLRLTNHLDAVGRFQAALAAVQTGDSGIALAMASRKEDRNRLRDFLTLVGLKIREKSKTFSVERTDNKQAAERVRELTALGIDLAKLASRLNAGEAVRIQIPIELVPVPLNFAIWGEAVFHKTVPPGSLFSTIVSDRRAALLLHGLAALDEETIAYFAANPALVTRVYEHHAAAFSAFGDAVRIRAGRVVPPGGPEGARIWEAVLGEQASRPERFIRELLGQSDGRVALVYEVLTQLDAPHVNFAHGTWIADPAARISQFKMLLDRARARDEWNLNLGPFRRPAQDVTLLLMRVRVRPDGSPASPSARVFWQQAFDGVDIPDDPAKRLRNVNEDGPITAGWLAEAIAVDDPRIRQERLDQLSFGQRAFGSAGDADLPGALVAVRSLPRFRMLMLTLDRMGVRDARVYAAAARQAHQITALDGRRKLVALGVFQGALAIVDRLVRVHTLTSGAAGALVASLAAVPLDEDGRYHGRIAGWITAQVAPSLKWPSNADADTELVRALAGIPDPAAAKVVWEGRTYRVDLVSPERARLTRAREKMSSPSIRIAIDFDRIASKMSESGLSIADVKAAVAELRTIAASLPKPDKRVEPVLPPGVDPPKNPIEVAGKVLQDLAKITQPKDLKKASHAAEPLFGLSDEWLAQGLMSLAYALDLGDPDGTILMGGDVSRRHDFGFQGVSDDQRIRLAWAEPRHAMSTTTPWHVTGSLLGLDLGLAHLALRRIDTGEVPPPPTLSLPDHDSFSRTVPLINPFDLTDTHRDAIVAAIERGRARVAAAVADPSRWDELADQARLDGWRRRAGRWAITSDPASVPSFFSLTDLYALGGPPADAPAGRWGMSGDVVDGCLCPVAPLPGGSTIVMGRPQLGALATQVADLNLHIAERLGALHLPAALARGVLAAATQDFLDQVRPIHGNDWLTMVRAAQAIPDDRIADYIAALTADGPLVAERSTAAGGGRR